MTKPLNMNTYNKFTFVGEVVLGKEPVTVREGSSKYGKWKATNVNLGIKAKTGDAVSTQFLSISSMSGSYDSFITYDKEGNKMEVPFSESRNIEIIKNVMSPRQIIVDLTEDDEERANNVKNFFQIASIERRIKKGEGDSADPQRLKELEDKIYSLPDRHYFIHESDFVKFMIENAEKIEGKRLKVMGDIVWSYGKNGKLYVNFEPNTIMLASEKEGDRLDASIDIAFHHASVDESSIETDKKLIINGFVQDYSRVDKGMKLFPQQFVLDLQNVDFNNEQEMKIVQYLKSCYTSNEDIVKVLKTEIEILNGATEIKLTDEEKLEKLSDEQRLQIDLGLADEKDFLSDSVIGEKVQEFRIIKPVLKGMYKEGAVEIDLNEEGIYDNLAQSVKVASEDEISSGNTKEENSISSSDVDDALNRLFKKGSASDNQQSEDIFNGIL